MKADKLEEAIKYRDRLKELRIFRTGLTGADPLGRKHHGGICPEGWDGPIECTFGGYKVELSMRCFKREFLALIDSEERMILNTLGMLGVTVDD